MSSDLSSILLMDSLLFFSDSMFNSVVAVPSPQYEDRTLHLDGDFTFSSIVGVCRVGPLKPAALNGPCKPLLI